MATNRLRAIPIKERALIDEPTAGRRERNWTDDDEEPISEQTPSSDQIIAGIDAIEKGIRAYFPSHNRLLEGAQEGTRQDSQATG